MDAQFAFHLHSSEKCSDASKDKTSVGNVANNRKLAAQPSYTGRAIRILFLDIPVFAVLCLFASMVWLRHVRDQYLLPQYKAAEFNVDRSWGEITYYTRTCDSRDLTTGKGSDLFLPYDATADDAYRHNLKHGFTVFRRGLKEETAVALRNYIVDRNRKLKDSEKIFVLEGDKRYSFGLGTEEPTVVTALKEIVNSPSLRPALEKVLGPDPALVEMTAITSTYGAKSQYWHDDVISSGSAINFGRTFGPIYSLFIQLQNTTAAMGATGACPGTHFCSEGDFTDLCTKHGFQLANENGHWGIGDALLMNQNSYHRGAAHIDPNGLDRVMFILSFLPKPTQRAETRLMSQGITFSLRWDMWGHTLNDFVNAETSMNQPWATLRALGLYKRPGTSWGVDYISGATMRMANNEYGFRDYNLEGWLSYGGFGLPKWLEADVDPKTKEGTWFAYVNGTFDLCFQFLRNVCISSVIVYLSIFIIQSGISSEDNALSHSSNAMLRLSIMLAIVGAAYYRAKVHVDESGWAKDITAGRRYSSTTELERRSFAPILKEYITDTEELRTTLPNQLDVLIETRYGGKQLALYNDFINNHPGNEYMLDIVKQQSATYKLYPPLLQNASAHFVANAVESRCGRFLLQNPDGYWIWMSKEDSVRYVSDQLLRISNPLLNDLLWTIRLLESDLKYGEYRDSALYLQHSSSYLRQLKTILTNNYKKHDTPATSDYVEPPRRKENIFDQLRSFSIADWRPLLYETHNEIQRSQPMDIEFEPSEPMEDAWIATGDDVEAWGENYWYYCTVKNVSAFNTYFVVNEDGEEESVSLEHIRHYQEHYIGEEVEVKVSSDSSYYAGVIRDISEDGYAFSIRVPKLKRTLYDIDIYQMRRYDTLED
jgi:hypothetical protein